MLGILPTGWPRLGTGVTGRTMGTARTRAGGAGARAEACPEGPLLGNEELGHLQSWTHHLGAADSVESARDPASATCPDVVLKLLTGNLLLAAAVTRQGELGAGLVVCLHVGRAAGRPAVPAAEAPLRALVLQVVLLLAQAHEAFTRRALGQHERAVSFMAALVVLQGPLPGAALAGADGRQALHLPAGSIVRERRAALQD